MLSGSSWVMPRVDGNPFATFRPRPAGSPVTKSSGKSHVVLFRYACNKLLRYASYWFSFVSLNRSEWANKYYRDQRARGESHHQALRALAAKWLKILLVMWQDDETVR